MMRARQDRRSAIAGFTLVEVLAGLILMATVMASAMTAFNRHQKQVVASRRLQSATVYADAILQELSARRGGIPDSSSGVVAAQPTWRWQTQTVGLAAPVGVPAKVVRFRILQTNGVEILHVDVVLPIGGADG